MPDALLFECSCVLSETSAPAQGPTHHFTSFHNYQMRDCATSTSAACTLNAALRCSLNSLRDVFSFALYADTHICFSNKHEARYIFHPFDERMAGMRAAAAAAMAEPAPGARPPRAPVLQAGNASRDDDANNAQ